MADHLVRRGGLDLRALLAGEFQPAPLAPPGPQQGRPDAGRLADLLVEVEQLGRQVGGDLAPAVQPERPILVDLIEHLVAPNLGLGPGLPSGGEAGPPAPPGPRGPPLLLPQPQIPPPPARPG